MFLITLLKKTGMLYPMQAIRPSGTALRSTPLANCLSRRSFSEGGSYTSKNSFHKRFGIVQENRGKIK